MSLPFPFAIFSFLCEREYGEKIIYIGYRKPSKYISIAPSVLVSLKIQAISLRGSFGLFKKDPFLALLKLHLDFPSFSYSCHLGWRMSLASRLKAMLFVACDEMFAMSLKAQRVCGYKDCLPFSTSAPCGCIH